MRNSHFHIRKFLLILSALMILTACTAAQPTPLDQDQLADLFSYDPSLPLGLEIVEEEQEPDVRIQVITYRGGMGYDVPAYLVSPYGEGPYPAVIFLQKANADISHFFVEGIVLSESGVVALLPASPLGADPWQVASPAPVPASDTRSGIIRQVLDVRRGLDLLASLPQVDMNRVALVGHSDAATTAGLIAGVEDRIHAYAVIAGAPQFSTVLPENWKDGSKLGDLAPSHYIGQAAPASVLFQFGDEDEIVTPEEAEQFYNAANQPKEIIWYTADHKSVQWLGRLDRIKWLSAQLGIEYDLED
jgi:dienelactone hydrolase